MTEKLFFNICASLINLTYKKRRCNFNMCTFLHIKIRAANESEDEAKARSCRRRLFLLFAETHPSLRIQESINR